jgi:hypothetical protein
MAVARLQITWDGNVPGLPEHRLSLAAFDDALRELLSAVRRIATDLERSAWPTTDIRHAGRLTKEAHNLDVQIAAIKGNSPLTLDLAIVEIEAPKFPLIHDLGERAVSRFLDDLRREAAGELAHYRVRKFLQSLPVGLSAQRYVHERSDGSVQDIELGKVRLAESISAAYLVRVAGELVGVGFEPGRSEVRIKTSNGDTFSMAATSAQVDEALTLRSTAIHAIAVVQPPRARLLRFGDRVPGDPKSRADYVFDTWSEVLKRLAQ